jgi:hypothetical protein
VEKKNRSWFSLLVFCTATTVMSALVLAVIFASATVVYSVAQPADPSSQSASDAAVPAKTFSGIITDAHCGAKHKFTDKAPAECTRICVKNGSRYVLVDGDRMYGLQGDVVQLNRMAGQRVTITGTLADNSINVASISNGQ